MASAAEFFENPADIHRRDPASGDQMGFVSHLHHEKKRVKALGLSDLMRQIRDVRHVMRSCHGRDHHGNAVNLIAFCRSDEVVQDRDLVDRKFPREEIGYYVQMGALRDQIGSGQGVPLGGRDKGERTGLFIDAKRQDRGFCRCDRDLLLLQKLHHDRGGGADFLHDLDVAPDIALCRGMVIKDQHGNARPAEHPGKLAEPGWISVINDDELRYIFDIDVPEPFGLYGVERGLQEKVTHVLFLRSREHDRGLRIELLCRDHGGKGVEISVRMTGDDVHGLISDFGLRISD